MNDIQALNCKEWITALRSGRYQQVQGVLKNHSGYCCLGVARDISDEELVTEGDSWIDPDNHSDVLPDYNWMMKNYGITSVECRDLASYNDERDMEFDEIADEIEAIVVSAS